MLGPNYKHFLNLFNLNSDIALIKLPSPVNFTKVIQPITLSCKSSNWVGVTAIGNGYMLNKNRAPILQYADKLKTISLFLCVFNYPKVAFRTGIMCAVGLDESSVCMGDSGGPLIDNDSNKLVGITSFGPAHGCDFGLAQAFTRVSAYTKWIEKKTGIKCN